MARKRRIPGLYLRGEVWWCWRDPITGRRCSTGCTDATAAQLWRAERERLAHTPADVAAQTATVSEWLGRFLSHKRERLSVETVDFYETKVGHIERLLGGLTLSAIGPSVVDDYVSTRRGECVGDYTIQRELQALIGALKMAKRAGVCPVDLQALMPPELDTGSTPVERYLTAEQVGKLLAAMPDARWRAFVAICVGLGCRRSEALKMRREYFQRQTEVVTLEGGEVRQAETWLCWIDGTKTEDSDRAVPVLSCYVELVKSAFPAMPIGNLDNWVRVFKDACQRAGVPYVSPNDLRRTHATLLGEAGVPDEFVARLLGHTTTAMAKRVYNRAKAARLAPVAEKMLEAGTPIVIAVPRGAEAPPRPALQKPVEPVVAPEAWCAEPAIYRTPDVQLFACGSDLRRAPQDLNLRPPASKAEAEQHENRGTAENRLHQLASTRSNARQFARPIARHAHSPTRGIGSQALVPVIYADGSVSGWEPVTEAEVEADLAPRPVALGASSRGRFDLAAFVRGEGVAHG